MKAVPGELEIVLEESSAGGGKKYPERTIACIEDDEVLIFYQFFIDGEWENYPDMGANITIANYMLLASLIESRAALGDAAKRIESMNSPD